VRYGFVTCVELGKACIEEILAAGGHFELLMTLRDDLAVQKSGRVYLDELADTHDITLVKVRNINDADALDAIQKANLDWLFLIGWSQIARLDFLKAPRRGVLGAHPTLLPQGRGRAAVPWAILKGLDRTGVTLFVVDEGVDTGPIVSQMEIPLAPDEDATRLYRKVNEAHRQLIRETWPQLEDDSVVPRPQDDSRASEWPGRRPEDGRIVSDMTTTEIDRLVRAVTRPYPGASWSTADGRELRVWSGRVLEPGDVPQGLPIPCADGVFDATEVEV
jgi:methionyl-tRNA formyltransferase